MSQGFKIVRPIEYNIGSYQQGLTESAVNIFKVSAEPTDFNENRASWSVRSPGLNTLLSSQVFMSFDLEIRTPSKMYDYASARSANYAIVRGAASDVSANQNAGATVTCAFGEGNPLAYAMQSYQVVINGAQLQQIRMNEWKNTIDKLMIPAPVMQRRFGRCGGAWNAWDSVACSGDAFIETAAAINFDTANCRVVSAFTQDSGIAKRIQGVLACTKVAPALNAGGVGADIDVRIIRVRAPLDGCGLMNPLGRQDYVSSACALKDGTFCIPHANVLSFNFLFSNFFKTIIRNLSAQYTLGNATVAQGGGVSNITVQFPVQGGVPRPNARLELSYLRLPSWRSIPATRTLSCYRCAVHDLTSGSPTGPVMVHANCLDGGIAKAGLPCVGVDRAGNPGGGAAMRTTAYWEANWNGINMSQIPSYVAFLLPKSTDAYTLANSDHLGNAVDYTAAGAITRSTAKTSGLKNQFIARNTASCAAVVALDLMIQSSIGSYVYSSEDQYLKDRSELFADTIKNSYLDYMEGCEFRWSRHNCCVFLESSSFARGLGSEGSSLPVVFNAKCRFENRREFIDGTGAAAEGARGPGVVRDVIIGKPLFLAFFNRMSIALSPSAALVSSQNVSHASALQLLSQTSG